MTYGRICPNCGNRNPDTILDNGLKPNHPDLTLLCIKRVSESVTSYEMNLLEPKDLDDQGRPECGWQWEPNGPDYRDDMRKEVDID